MLKRFAPLIAALSLIGSPAPTFAQAPANGTAGDPNEKICENIIPVGSRLARKRVCATRAEWDERRRLDRQAVEQAQKQIGGPCQTTPASKSGGPTLC
jgi:hypothetical protein